MWTWCNAPGASILDCLGMSSFYHSRNDKETLGVPVAALGILADDITCIRAKGSDGRKVGEKVAGVIVPIDLWREIQSEKEAAYLLKSETMKNRLSDAIYRKKGIPFDEACKKLGV